jgi:hypothetical protein
MNPEFASERLSNLLKANPERFRILEGLAELGDRDGRGSVTDIAFEDAWRAISHEPSYRVRWAKTPIPYGPWGASR